MAFKDTWKPRIDGVDVADSSAVNEIAEEVIRLAENQSSGGVTQEEFQLRIEPIENDINDIYDEIGKIDTALDSILAIQNELIGG
jgi:hypothetical protein